MQNDKTAKGTARESPDTRASTHVVQIPWLLAILGSKTFLVRASYIRCFLQSLLQATLILVPVTDFMLREPVAPFDVGIKHVSNPRQMIITSGSHYLGLAMRITP